MALKTLFTGQNLLWMDEVDSTNSVLMGLAKNEKLAHGSVVCSYNQTAGRGQRGNSWQSEPNKNITASVYYQLGALPVANAFVLNKIVSLAVADTLKTIMPNQSVKIKWPNDIFVDNKKIAGILIENTLKQDAIAYTIIGVGININQEKFDVPTAVSVKNILGIDYDLNSALNIFLENLEALYLQLRSAKTGELNKGYFASLYKLSELQKFQQADNTFEATIEGVNEHGKLILKKKNGTAETYNFKEIKWIHEN
jgi:BirA family biotin operon repressor/biotin-[acetyl-CoA-carboxylase] ligase